MGSAVEQTSATTPQPASPETQDASGAADAAGTDARPGFVARGRLRRRARFLRKARELAYRDLGGLVFSLHRFGQRNDALVSAKLTTLGQIDAELRALESSLQEREPVAVLREAGITACPRCAAIHGSEDRFCPNCGLPLSRHVDLPIAGPPSGTPGAGAAGEGADKPRTWAPPGTAPPGPTPARYATAPEAAASGSAGATRQAPIPAPPGTSGPGAASTGGAAAASPPAGSAPGATPAAPSARADDDEPTEVVRPRPGSA